MAENQNFTCSGNCMKCLPVQRAYCASQHAYSNMKVLDKLMGEVLEMKGTINNLNERLETMQNSEKEVFNPDIRQEQVVRPPVNIAPEGGSADNQLPQ